MVNAISTLVGEELEGEDKYAGTLAGNNGSIYGIPATARRVVKFNLLDKSMIHIGPDLGDDRWKWRRGAITDGGIIYCIPFYCFHGILKIDTNTDTVTELDRNLPPERGGFMWNSCATALDGCVYFIPYNARRIMKLDPNNDDAMSSVGDDLGDEEDKYIGTVVGIDGCVYGIPSHSKRILKYDPINDTTSFVGKKADACFKCTGSGALGRNGCIYAVTRDGRVLKIDTTNNVHCFVGNSVESDHYDQGWGDAIFGIDGCIYWPPDKAHRILKYDPHTNKASLEGDDFGEFGYEDSKCNKWRNGALAADGVIYCLPLASNQVLSIDPLKEFSMNVRNNMNGHVEPLSFLFQIKESDIASNQTYFDYAVAKFGLDRVLEVLEEHLPLADRVCSLSNLYPFMIAASYEKSALSLIYYLLRQYPSLLNQYCTYNEKKPKRILAGRESDTLEIK